jgi:hypothetical protein
LDKKLMRKEEKKSIKAHRKDHAPVQKPQGQHHRRHKEKRK